MAFRSITWLIPGLALARAAVPSISTDDEVDSFTTSMGTAEREITALAASRDPRFTPQIDISLWETFQEQFWVNRESPDIPLMQPRTLNMVSMIHMEKTEVFEIMEPVGWLWQSEIPTGLLVIYRAFCSSPEHSIHTAVVDYWFLAHLRETGLVPQVYQVSAPLNGAEVFGQDGKVGVESCSISPRKYPEVRYIIMEKVNGQSLNMMIEKRTFTLVELVGFTIQMIETLQTLHSHNVVHGDAHYGNFLFDEHSLQFMKLIDFERAHIFNKQEILAMAKPCEMDDASPNLKRERWYSPWETRGCVISFRDDIHRVFLSLAALMHGLHYEDYFDRLAESVYTRRGGKLVKNKELSQVYYNTWTMHRLAGEIFVVMKPESLNTVIPDIQSFTIKSLKSKFHLRKDQVTELTKMFVSLETYIVGLELTDIPNYGYIVEVLRNIATAAAPRTPTKPENDNRP